MSDVRSGRLKVYLGAAPGVGKTYRMLDEGRRRAERGADVVVAFAECHGRPRTEAMLGGLETVPRARCVHHGAPFEEMDLAAVLARHPQVAIVDEFAHSNAPGDGRNPKRWQDIEALLAAGIDVITALNVQHLESLNDVVEKITHVPQHETVPDEVVRRAHQVELVDMPPEGLRRRMAHGNIHAPEKVDAALANYFRPGNLTALRQLALLWVADRVDEALQTYRAEHSIGGVWETRERVAVALTGGPEGDTLIRRAARIAARSAGGALLAVHVARSDGLAGGVSHASLARQRRLVEDLGGSYHSVVGDDIATTLVEFARAENATQLVLGSSRRGRLERFLTGRGTGETVTELSGDIDVHRVTHERAGRGTLLPSRRRTLSRARRIAGPVVGFVLPALLTAALAQLRGTLNLTSEALIFLLTVVGVACIGGVVSALIASVTASLLLNYWFVPPIGSFTLDDPNALLALGVFAAVAATVAAAVDRALRLSRRSARATAEAETMSSLAGSIVRGGTTIPALLERTRETFGMDSAELVAEPPDAERVTAVPAGPGAHLVLRGRTLSSSERRVLAAFAAHVGSAVERARLAEAAAEVEPVKAADRMRTALLRAVGHDLRTPLAAGWAAVASLRSRDVEFSAEDRDELLATADESMAKLSRLVENLLDLSRLEAGALTLNLRATTLEEVLPMALADVPVAEARGVEEIPAVLADPPLLERVVANLVANAARHTPPGQRVLVTASALAGRVELRVVDRGPGLPAADRDRVFEPFQRLGDTDNTTGLGLGLALARGLTEAMNGTLTPEDTPGGGLTMVVSLPFADRTETAHGTADGTPQPREKPHSRGAAGGAR
ncbi:MULTISPECIES: sensor histidine kinase [unclassified Streptomyces]|uniref:sensor histidine kinase n=1 Tax=unclassified Streptomyces TaxID=2593676 RepID=UPI0008DFDE73|nr:MULTISPECIES: ATP-binding protein [unclassified Streptomyces]UJV41834.1 sensor histidine kinase KdpD [Streptomyces sp. AMCC400023]SFN69007.1 two-component system, OmpR family, sensor histidine kinase KdpD [Streptomyces sp. cf124]